MRHDHQPEKIRRSLLGQQTITPIHELGGDLTHFVSLLQNITELRKQEEHDCQLLLARRVQQQFYGSAPVAAGFDLGGASYPVYETGGDYFDFIAMRMVTWESPWATSKDPALAPPWSCPLPVPICTLLPPWTWNSTRFSSR